MTWRLPWAFWFILQLLFSNLRKVLFEYRTWIFIFIEARLGETTIAAVQMEHGDIDRNLNTAP